MIPQSSDVHWMALACQWALKGQYTAKPNPMVGCVIVCEERCIGAGYHERAGFAHAEVNALNSVADRNQLKQATVYITLSPCRHVGRTPPCTEALIHAQVKRVVVGVCDPFDIEQQWMSQLENAGIQILVLEHADEAKSLVRPFLSRIARQRPWVILKSAMSLDGKVAKSNGQSQWITGQAAREDVHHHRAMACAILTGSGTVLTDNPRLDARIESELISPMKVLLDSQGQVAPSAAIFHSPGQTLVASAQNHPQADWVGQDEHGHVDLKGLLSVLSQKHDINQVWVEAGPRLSGALLSQGLVDEIILYVAPKILGHQAKSLAHLSEVHDVNDRHWQFLEPVMLGQDLKIRLVKR